MHEAPFEVDGVDGVDSVDTANERMMSTTSTRSTPSTPEQRGDSLIAHLSGRVSTLRVLVAGWEGGVIWPTVESPDLRACLDRDGMLECSEGHDALCLDIGRAGGMSIVVSELPGQVERAAARRGLDWRMAGVAPLLWDAVRIGGCHGLNAPVGRALWDSLVTEEPELRRVIEVGGGQYPVRFWKLETPRTTQFLVQQDRLWGPGRLATRRRQDGGVELDLYGVPDGEDDFPLGVNDPRVLTSRHAMARCQRIRYLVFARAVAHLVRELGFDVLVANDYHVGIVPFLDPDVVQLSIWHNLGYQGIDAFYSPDGPSPDVPVGEDTRSALLDDHAAATGIPSDVLDDFFVAWRREGFIGTPNWAQAILRLNTYRTGLAGTTVSASYARQLATEDRAHVLERIREQRGPLPDGYFDHERAAARLEEYFEGETDRDDFHTPACGLPDLSKLYIEGVLNGMHPEKTHLRYRDDFLASLLLAFARAGARGMPRARRLVEALGYVDEPSWLAALEPPCELTRSDVTTLLAEPGAPRPADRFRTVEHLVAVKTLARELLAEDPRFAVLRETGDDLPVLFSWGRLVSQKAFHVIAEAARHLAGRGVLIVQAAAPAADREGLWVERRLREIEHPRLVFVNEVNPWLRDLCKAAASIAPLTSLYEPCGLTDIEAYWSGVLCVVHEVGGLVKGMIDEAPHYDQIVTVAPAREPVCRGYRAWDSTDPRHEAEAFVAAADELLDLYRDDRPRFGALQLKALDLMQLTWDIPADRYVDLLQYVWLGQVWRRLKDGRSPDAVTRMMDIIDRGAGFVPGSGRGCAGSLRELYTRVFHPPRDGVGVPRLDEDLILDRELRRRLD